MNWFYALGGTQQGPVSTDQLRVLVSNGTINGETLVWRDGMAAWLPLRQADPSLIAPLSPSLVAPATPAAALSSEIPPGHVRCALTSKIIPESEAIYISGRPYAPEAKDAVLASIQESGALPISERERNGPAWEKRKEIGWFTALGTTIKDVMLSPDHTFRTMRRTGGLLGPLWFYMITAGIGIVGAGVSQLILMQIEGQLGSERIPLHLEYVLIAIPLLLVCVPLLAALGCFVTSALVHLGVMIISRNHKGFETTFRAVCYGYGAPSVLQLVPLCGIIISCLWVLVSAVYALSRGHEVSTGRAIAMIFAPGIVCCCIIAAIGFAAGMFFPAFSHALK